MSAARWVEPASGGVRATVVWPRYSWLRLHTALAVLVGLVLLHALGGEADDVERADQVDLDDPVENAEVVRALAADGAHRHGDSGAVDDGLDGTARVVDGASDGGAHLVLVGNVRGHESRAGAEVTC